MDRQAKKLRVGMVGMGMIFDETYRHVFEQWQHAGGFWHRDYGCVEAELAAVATRTGARAETYRRTLAGDAARFQSFVGPGAMDELLASGVDVVCVATPDDRHYEPARKALQAGKHVLIEKPSVLCLSELDDLIRLSREQQVLCKVVYHKLADPDHKALRTRVANGTLKHVNSGYCSLLEPKSISQSQFSEWIAGRNPATYVAVHYIKLIDFTFAATDLDSRWRLHRISANGQRGLTANAWDSVHLQFVYRDRVSREAAFDIHTSWVMPNNFPGYVEQEVQFRFDNAIWNAHQRKRGVEVCIEGYTPEVLKITPNHHYNAQCLEPWGEMRHRGYGLEVIERFFHEVAYVEYAEQIQTRAARFNEISQLRYNDIAQDKRVIAVVQALEQILSEQAAGSVNSTVTVDEPGDGLWLWKLGASKPEPLYAGRVNSDD